MLMQRSVKSGTWLLRLSSLGAAALVLILLARAIRLDRESLLPMLGMAVVVGLLVLNGISHCRAARRQSRADEGRCLECGYDLRATPYRCPECGTTTQRWSAVLRRRLAEAWPHTAIAPRPLVEGERVVVVHASLNAIEVNLLQQHLEARGVACRCETRKATCAVRAEIAPDVHGLFVRPEELEQAERIIEQLLAAEPPPHG